MLTSNKFLLTNNEQRTNNVFKIIFIISIIFKFKDAINKLKDKGGDAVNVTVITHDIDTEFTVDKMG